MNDNTGLTFNDCIERLRDGKAYAFTNANLNGYFYKAPFPANDDQTKRDGAVSAITYWDKGYTAKLASPTLMLHDFDDDADWTIREVSCHPELATIPHF